KNKCQRRDPEFDDVKNFFSEPYHCKGDLSEIYLIKSTKYLTVLSNLWTHLDGSCKTGRVSDGCPQSQNTIEKGAKLPSTSLKEGKTKTDTKEGLASSHFNQAESFEKKTLNSILSLELLNK
ncbi:hypothetical protein VP01_6485g1, partial [Puccinia sorghi]